MRIDDNNYYYIQIGMTQQTNIKNDWKMNKKQLNSQKELKKEEQLKLQKQFYKQNNQNNSQQ